MSPACPPPVCVHLLGPDAPSLQLALAHRLTQPDCAARLHLFWERPEAGVQPDDPVVLQAWAAGAVPPAAARTGHLPDGVLLCGATGPLDAWRPASSAVSQLHGDTAQQLRQALSWLGLQFVQRGWHWPVPEALAVVQPRWLGACEQCSDADCEHQLFSRLLQARDQVR